MMSLLLLNLRNNARLMLVHVLCNAGPGVIYRHSYNRHCNAQSQYRTGSNSPLKTNYFTPCAGELIPLGSLRTEAG